MMAADARLIPESEKVIAVAGTGKGHPVILNIATLRMEINKQCLFKKIKIKIMCYNK